MAFMKRVVKHHTSINPEEKDWEQYELRSGRRQFYTVCIEMKMFKHKDLFTCVHKDMLKNMHNSIIYNIRVSEGGRKGRKESINLNIRRGK